MAASFPELEKSGSRNNRSGFCFEHVTVGVLNNPQSEGVKYVVGYTSLELWGEVGTRDRNVGVNSIEEDS